jgi:hypothetical protein
MPHALTPWPQRRQVAAAQAGGRCDDQGGLIDLVNRGLDDLAVFHVQVNGGACLSAHLEPTATAFGAFERFHLEPPSHRAGGQRDNPTARTPPRL